MIFRLCVDDYHRYCYIDNGIKGGNKFIGGELHINKAFERNLLVGLLRNIEDYTMFFIKLTIDCESHRHLNNRLLVSGNGLASKNASRRCIVVREHTWKVCDRAKCR